MPQPFWVDPFEIKMIPAADPITRDVLDLLRQYGGHNPGRFPVPRLGEVTIDEVYIYPEFTGSASRTTSPTSS
jgi:hypothetical protein